MVEPHDDLLRAKAAQQHVLHEGLGLDGGQLGREAHDHHAVDAGLADQRQALVHRGDASRSACGLQDLGGVLLEGTGERLQ